MRRLTVSLNLGGSSGQQPVGSCGRQVPAAVSCWTTRGRTPGSPDSPHRASQYPLAMMPQTIGMKSTATPLSALGGRSRRDSGVHDSEIHIVAGLLLPIWKRLPSESTRCIGCKRTPASASLAARSHRVGGRCAGCREVESFADDAFAALIDGKTILDLAEGLQSGASRDGCEPDRITGFPSRCGIAYRLRPVRRDYFVEATLLYPSRRPGPAILGKVLSATRLRASPIGGGVTCRAMRRSGTSLAREAEAVCRRYLSNVAVSAITGRSAMSEHGGPIDVRPLKPKGPGGRAAANGPTRQPVSMGSP